MGLYPKTDFKKRSTIISRRGFTLIEIMIVVVILGILMVAAVSAYELQNRRGLDARRKGDLAKLKIQLEDYYNDKHCYPSIVTMSLCNKTDLQPYVAKVPCDPQTGKPYGYLVDASCRYYAVFTTLGDTNDPDIKSLNCSPTCTAGKTYNFGVTNSVLPIGTLASQATP
jgi:prepilin-type N-terminal cleavage/methylation domain-containing protein